MREVSLTSLAILKVNWDKGHDYIQNFVPFVAEAVRRAPQDEVSVVEVQQIVRNEFGLVIPQGALNTLLRRAERGGAVRREHGIYRRNSSAIDPSFEGARADFARQYQALIGKLVSFAETRGVPLTHDQADDALLGKLQDSCIPILAAAVDGCAIPPPMQKVKHAEYLVSAFTIHLFEKDPAGFSFLETVTKGSMLATALFLPEIAQANRRFDRLSVYLDTPLLLRAIGLQGTALTVAAKELLALLYELNVDLVCFEATRDEICRVLDAAKNALRDPRHPIRPFGVYSHLLSIGAGPSDVEVILNNIDRHLRNLHVSIRPAPTHTVQLGLDEVRLAHVMRSELPLQREEAHRHDLDALTAIYRLRRGAVKYRIEDCGFLFVTSNNGLAVAGARFTREQIGAHCVPLCVNDHTMATLGWIKNPTLVETFSRNRLIAQSYAALRPSAELWRKYLEEIERLQQRGDITDMDSDLLRFSVSAQNALVELTLGSAEVFTDGTVHEVLEVARADARRVAEQRLLEEQHKRANIESVISSQRIRISELASRVGNLGRLAVLLLIGTVCLVGFVMTLPLNLPKVSSDYVTAMLNVAILVFSGVGLWSLFSGGSVRQVSRSVEVRFSTWTAKVLHRLAGLPPE